jgi:hypothetical protein
VDRRREWGEEGRGETMMKLVGHANRETITTTAGTVWCLSRTGRYAWPLWGEDTDFGPYDIDVAAARGQEVDSELPPDDYRVTHAGSEWREVYDRLRAATTVV